MPLNNMIPDETQRQTLNLWPDAGRILGLSRGATFQAAKRGQIPTIRIGRRLLVPKAKLAKMLEAK
jgi:hypothetical protein